MLNDKNIEKNVDFLTESMYNRCKIYIKGENYELCSFAHPYGI